MGGHGDDRELGIAGVRSDEPGGFIAIHNRHLNIHQHQIVPRAAADHRHGLLTVDGYIHHRTGVFQKFDRQVLIHFVIFHQQDAGA